MDSNQIQTRDRLGHSTYGPDHFFSDLSRSGNIRCHCPDRLDESTTEQTTNMWGKSDIVVAQTCGQFCSHTSRRAGEIMEHGSMARPTKLLSLSREDRMRTRDPRSSTPVKAKVHRELRLKQDFLQGVGRSAAEPNSPAAVGCA